MGSFGSFWGVWRVRFGFVLEAKPHFFGRQRGFLASFGVLFFRRSRTRLETGCAAVDGACGTERLGGSGLARIELSAAGGSMGSIERTSLLIGGRLVWPSGVGPDLDLCGRSDPPMHADGRR